MWEVHTVGGRGIQEGWGSVGGAYKRGEAVWKGHTREMGQYGRGIQEGGHPW